MSPRRPGRRTPAGKREESAILADYGERYRAAVAEPRLAVERSVFGTDYGITSYTTPSHADRLVDLLALGPTVRVLDLGTGSGWPGLYLASRSGCELVGCDLPLAGLASARRRAALDGLTGRAGFIQSSARRLPFRHRSFDAIVSADVMC